MLAEQLCISAAWGLMEIYAYTLNPDQPKMFFSIFMFPNICSVQDWAISCAEAVEIFQYPYVPKH